MDVPRADLGASTPSTDARARSAPATSAEGAILIMPSYDFELDKTSMTIGGLPEGAHVVVSVPGIEDERMVFVGKRGRIHAFGFGASSGSGPIRIGDR